MPSDLFAMAVLGCKSLVLAIRNNFYIVNNDFANNFKIVSYASIGAIPAGLTITL